MISIRLRNNMKNIKKFEGFMSFHRDNCERCGEATGGKTTTSMFNLDIICMDCKDDEKNDPEYDAACKEESEAYVSGIVNFGGSFPDYKPLKIN